MLMWGDRLIDSQEINYGEWESSANGTASAIDMIPKDIIICDWHYESIDDYKTQVDPTEFKWIEKGKNRRFELFKGEGYTSIPMFISEGFRVLPTSWKNVENMKSLLNYSTNFNSPQMLGHLFTLWSSVEGEQLVTYPPMVEGLKLINKNEY